MIDPNVQGASTCSCGKRVVWATKEHTGNPHPFNYDPDDRGDWVISKGMARPAMPLFDAKDVKRYRSHFKDCPSVEKHRGEG